jgi:N4-(beta-N-acetylglucosaminyl)-L-asparaginase
MVAGSTAALGVAAGGGAGAARHQRPSVALAAKHYLESARLAVARMDAGVSPVEAAVAGVGLVEADPGDVTVGLGGLPNAEGVVQLDACCMDGPSMRAGAVAAIEGYKHPAQVALEVMRRTTRVLLVGEGAARFARQVGFREENLVTERARNIWRYWKANMSGRDDWVPVADEVDDPHVRWYIEKYGPVRPTGTINLCAVNGKGDLGGTTSTSGLFFKIPGRVGDSPIIGAGLYVDNDVGAAGSTGRGESVIQVVGSHSVVEFMGRGLSPTDACLETLKRLAHNTRIPTLLDDQGRPDFNVNFYAVNKRGEVGGAALWLGHTYAVCRSGEEPTLRDCAALYEQKRPRDENPVNRKGSG